MKSGGKKSMMDKLLCRSNKKTYELTLFENEKKLFESYRSVTDKSLEHIRKQSTPSCVFLSFETEEGYDIASCYNELVKRILDHFSKSDHPDK